MKKFKMVINESSFAVESLGDKFNTLKSYLDVKLSKRFYKIETEVVLPVKKVKLNDFIDSKMKGRNNASR